MILTTKQKAMCQMVWMEGMSQKRAGELLGIKQAAASRLLARAEEKVRRLAVEGRIDPQTVRELVVKAIRSKAAPRSAVR